VLPSKEEEDMMIRHILLAAKDVENVCASFPHTAL